MEILGTFADAGHNAVKISQHDNRMRIEPFSKNYRETAPSVPVYAVSAKLESMLTEVNQDVLRTRIATRAAQMVLAWLRNIDGIIFVAPKDEVGVMIVVWKVPGYVPEKK